MLQPFKPLKFVILGAPGSGKGTLSHLLLRDFPWLTWISTGQLLRDQVQQNTQLGQQIQLEMSQGQFVSESIMDQLMETVFHSSNSSKVKFQSILLDGYPRTLTQAQKLHQFTSLDAILQLDVPMNVLLERITHRWIHLPSGRTYHTYYQPPKKLYFDDVTNEPLTQRLDDTPLVFQQRLTHYFQSIQPVLQYYDHYDPNRLFRFTGNSSNSIYPLLHTRMQSFVESKSTPFTSLPTTTTTPSTSSTTTPTTNITTTATTLTSH